MLDARTDSWIRAQPLAEAITARTNRQPFG
jgi:hypothetical protein